MIFKGIVETIKKKPTGTYEEMVVFQLSTIATMLADISKSLAILAEENIDNAHVFTEQEIVKPYFERLKEEINTYKEVHDIYCEHIENGDFWANHTSDHYKASGGKATACDAILGMIDKILSEQEKEKSRATGNERN